MAKLRRHFTGKRIALPAYYLSVSYQNLSERKARWESEKGKKRAYPKVTTCTLPDLHDPSAGLIVRVEKDATVSRYMRCNFIYGIIRRSDGTILGARHHDVGAFSKDLSAEKIFATHKAFNELHSVRESTAGFMVVSSGTDSIFEMSKDGKKVLWSWFATENGFPTGALGRKRVLDKKKDHRMMHYDTWLRTVQVNTAIELPEDDALLATFFHQNMLAKIDRGSGKVTPIVEGLQRPHGARWSEGGRITFADSCRGISYRGRLRGDTFTVENSITIPSDWVQDCQFVDGLWIMVDDQHSRIVFGNIEGEIVAYDQYNTEWDFYDVAVA